MRYIVGHPIKHPEDFYGRSPQKQRFFEIISGPQTQSVTILGARRAGKTSFLRHVAHPSVMQQHLKEHEKYIMVYLDVSACKTPSEFYQRAIMTLQRAIPAVESVNLWSAPAQNEFTMFHLESVLCQFPNRRIILLLDEFDMIRTGTFTQDFLTELRALASVWEYELACVTASYWDLYQLGTEVGLPPTSPFYNIFYPTPIYMAGLASTELEKLVVYPAKEAGVAFSPQEVEQILRLGGTLPFFVQATAAAWLDLKRTQTAFAYNTLFSQLVANLSSYFAQWWRQFSKIEQTVLETAAHGETVVAKDFSEIELEEVTRSLQNFGFLDGDDSPNGEMFAYWLKYLPGKVATMGQQRAVSNGRSTPHTQPDLVPLFQQMMDTFNMQELFTLCFELGIDEETLTYQNKPELARAILQRAKRQGQLDGLVAVCREKRPFLPWLEKA